MASTADLVTEASQLGWKPGHFPQTFQRDGVQMYRFAFEHSDGELLAVRYHDGQGHILVVLND